MQHQTTRKVNSVFSCNLTMKEELINRFSTFLTHTTPVHHNNIPLRKLSKVKIFPKAVVYRKKVTLKGALTFQILFQEKGELTEVDTT